MNIKFLDCLVFGGPAIIAFGFKNVRKTAIIFPIDCVNNNVFSNCKEPVVFIE